MPLQPMIYQRPINTPAKIDIQEVFTKELQYANEIDSVPTEGFSCIKSWK